MAGDIHVLGPFDTSSPGCIPIGSGAMYILVSFLNFCQRTEPSVSYDAFLTHDMKIAGDCGSLSFIGCSDRTLQLVHKLLLSGLDPGHPFWKYDKRKINKYRIKWDKAQGIDTYAAFEAWHEEYRRYFKTMADAIERRLQGLSNQVTKDKESEQK